MSIDTRLGQIIVPLDTGGKDYVDQTPELQPVDTATGRVPIYGGLNAMQENFCRFIVNGKSRVQAYRLAYGFGPDKSSQALYNRASELWKKPAIQQRVEELMQEREEIAVTDYGKIRSFVIQQLQLEAQNKDSPAHARIRALELLGKMDKIQLFSDKTDAEEKPLDKKQISKELEKRLIAIMAQKPAIDVN